MLDAPNSGAHAGHFADAASEPQLPGEISYACARIDEQVSFDQVACWFVEANVLP
jgi:hypothetical protein